MKLFRRISALALAVVMICLLSASAFAANMTDCITRDGIDMYISARNNRTAFYADSALDIEDAVGNYLYIYVWCDYYMQGPSGNLYLINVTDADASDRVAETTDSWSCYLEYSPPDVYRMNFAEVTFRGEHSSFDYGYVSFGSVTYNVYYHE